MSYLSVEERGTTMNRKAFVLLVSVALMLAFVLPVLAQDGTGVTAQARDNVNVRSGPGVSYDAIGLLAMGETANVTGRSDAGNNWLQIDLNPSSEKHWTGIFLRKSEVVISENMAAIPPVGSTLAVPPKKSAADITVYSPI